MVVRAELGNIGFVKGKVIDRKAVERVVWESVDFIQSGFGSRRVGTIQAANGKVREKADGLGKGGLGKNLGKRRLKVDEGGILGGRKIDE